MRKPFSNVDELHVPDDETLTVLRVPQWRGIELAASIAHDMRGPLATITTSAELLEQELAAEDGAHLISVIQRQAFRLQQMIYDLAEYIKQPSAGITIQAEMVDLCELVREVTSEFQGYHSNHLLTLELPVAAIHASIDAEKIRRILLNLLGNAFQYSPIGKTVSVRLTVKNKRRVILEVEDQGSGIPLADRQKVFSPFVRLDGTSGSGQGLGLYIVRCMAEAHGGRAWVEDGAQGGARFCVSIPHAQPKGAELSQAI
jgi:signal transduction histidine kinase